jgi:hypothetical protein
VEIAWRAYASIIDVVRRGVEELSKSGTALNRDEIWRCTVGFIKETAKKP